jgi:photosystem II stability/assembly factor-like uncharacterized protein
LPPNLLTLALAAKGSVVFAALTQAAAFPSTINTTSLYRLSGDSGRWTRVAANGLPPTEFISELVVSGNDLFALVGGAVYRSRDDGANWTASNNGLPGTYAGVTLFARGAMLFLATTTELYRSGDQGANWSLLSNAPRIIYSFAASGANLFAGTTNGIYRSTDNGANWQALNNGLPPGCSSRSFLVAANSTRVFAFGGAGGIYRSANQGESWSAANTGLTNLNVKTLATLNPETNDARLFAGTDTGGFVANPNENSPSWQTANNGFASGGACPGASNKILTQANALFAQLGVNLFRSTDAGANWQRITSGPQGVTTIGVNRAALFASIGIVVIGTQPNLLGRVFRSFNQGDAWAEVSNGLPDSAVISLASAGGEKMVAGTQSAGVFLSTDNGGAWRAANMGLPERLTVYSLASLGETLFAATPRGLFVSANGGQSWTRAELGLPTAAPAYSVYTAGSYVFATLDTRLATSACAFGGILIDGRCYGALFSAFSLEGKEAELFVSADQGATWAAVGAGLPDGRATAIGVNGRAVFAGTDGGGVYVRQF